MNNGTHSPTFLTLICLGFTLCLSGCTEASHTMTAADLLGLMAQQRAPVVVDVRSAGEFAQGHIPGAIHIPFYAVGRRHQEISSEKDTPVLVYCAHGPRAWWAASVLRGKGFSQVSTLALSGNKELRPLIAP